MFVGLLTIVIMYKFVGNQDAIGFSFGGSRICSLVVIHKRCSERDWGISKVDCNGQGEEIFKLT